MRNPRNCGGIQRSLSAGGLKHKTDHGGGAFTTAWKIVQWPVAISFLLVSFALVRAEAICTLERIALGGPTRIADSPNTSGKVFVTMLPAP